MTELLADSLEFDEDGDAYIAFEDGTFAYIFRSFLLYVDKRGYEYEIPWETAIRSVIGMAFGDEDEPEPLKG